MDNLETLATMWNKVKTQSEDKQNNKTYHRKLKRSATWTHQKRGMKPGATDGLAGPVSYKISDMLLITSRHHNAQISTKTKIR